MNEVMEKFSSQVAVTEIYDACIALGKMEKFVISELEALQTHNKPVRVVGCMQQMGKMSRKERKKRKIH